MDTQMKIDAAIVRALREEMSWSQEHLASVAGLSSRTVQRVEAEGSGSAETRLAIAAALGISVARLTPAVAPQLSQGYRRGVKWGWGGLFLGAAGAFSGIVSEALRDTLSAAQLGASVGVTCALIGTFAAALGYASRRAASSQAAA